MLTCRSLLLFRVDRALKFSTTYVKPRPVDCFQGHYSYFNLSCNWKMSGGQGKQDTSDRNKKVKTTNLVWRPKSTQACFGEECMVKDITVESEDISQTQEVYCQMSSDVPDCQHVMVTEAVTKVTGSTSSSQMQDNVDDRASEGESEFPSERHSLPLEIGASVIRFVKGKEGSMQKKIEEELGVKIIFPSSRKEDSIIIEGVSLDSVTRASKRIQAIVDEAVKSPNLDYSHFVSLPLAIHPELVDKLVNFQNSILGNSGAPEDENMDSDSNEDTSNNEAKDQQLDKRPNVAVELKVGDDNEHAKEDVTSIPLVSYAPKASRSSTVYTPKASRSSTVYTPKASRSSTVYTPKASKSSTLYDLGIDKSIFINPKTFHLTVLMLKLWNKDRVNAATEVLKSISSKVMDVLDNRPIYVRLKGLDCMRGSPAKAWVLYAPVEEIGNDGRLLRACQVIIDAFTEAGLVLEKDAKHKLKLHATVMNARHSQRKERTRKLDSFDARGIFKQFGSEEWGEYLIREAHLSQRFLFDDSGYYHCCASIPFPEKMLG